VERGRGAGRLPAGWPMLERQPVPQGQRCPIQQVSADTRRFVKRRCTGLLLAALAIAVANDGPAQEIAGVKLGSTTVKDVRRVRGSPTSSGHTEDGKYYHLRYGEYAFYFSGPDSIAVSARVFPSLMTRELVESVFGEPIQEMRRPSLALQAQYNDTVFVKYDPAGEQVIFIEYHMSPSTIERVEPLRRVSRLAAATHIARLCEVYSNRVPSAALDSLSGRAPAGVLPWIAEYRRIDVESGTACATAQAEMSLELHRLVEPDSSGDEP